MTSDITLMRREIDEIPHAIDRLLSLGGKDIQDAAEAARALAPRFLLSVARGSSDHACTYLKYAGELVLRRPMASALRSAPGVSESDA